MRLQIRFFGIVLKKIVWNGTNFLFLLIGFLSWEKLFKKKKEQNGRYAKAFKVL